MKTEDFDDAIKRKLESINPAVDEKDIERVHRYTVVNRSPFSMLKSNRVFWALMATGMLVTGLITWKLTSLNVVKQNSGSVVQTESIPSQTAVKNPATVITKTDTVYIPKYINKYTETYRKPKGFINNNIKGKHNQFAQKPASKTESGDAQLSGNKQNENIDQNADFPGEPNINPKSPSALAGNQSSNTGSNAETPSANATPNFKNASALKSDDTATGNKEPLDKDITKKAPIHNYSDEHKLPHAKKSLVVNFMAGLGGELANTQIGGGVSGKVIFNNVLSLNAGVKWMSINPEHYTTDQAFTQATGYDFLWTYAPSLPAYCDVENINFTYSLWQIPLALEYDFPINRNWSISTSLGTDLDVSCINSLTYDYSEGYEGYQHTKQTINYPTAVFNNLVASVGVIKQWHHFAIQVSPFVSQQIEKAWYKGTDKTFYGADLKVFYCF